MYEMHCCNAKALDIYFASVSIVQVAEPINFITVVRSPREHFLSYYYYYMQPTHKVLVDRRDGGVPREKCSPVSSVFLSLFGGLFFVVFCLTEV